ncbi:hypothetical protein EVAR_21465_1 [Eumeta japonica]|uniref:Uncharacterized protein n=1 Tax=Eumeta variegata TaxID=151549 RepID=A0A4C1VH81_EUMVA|nr:hypothetical protein EVAR_21465_1 [Eumeta japonica]
MRHPSLIPPKSPTKSSKAQRTQASVNRGALTRCGRSRAFNDQKRGFSGLARAWGGNTSSHVPGAQFAAHQCVVSGMALAVLVDRTFTKVGCEAAAATYARALDPVELPWSPYKAPKNCITLVTALKRTVILLIN